MSKDQRLKNQPTARGEPVIRWWGESHTIAEACGLAMKAQQSGNLRAAVDIYDLILAQVPAYAQVHDNRGNILLAMRRPAEALASFDQAITLMPGYANAHNNRGAALQQLNRHEEALASFDRSIALDPARANAHNNRGASLHQLKRHEEALASFDQAIALKPDYVNAHYNRGATLQEFKRLEDALASYDKVLRLKPDHSDSYNNRGLVLQRLGRHDEALASFDRASALNPGHVKAQNNRGALLHTLQRHKEALASFDRAIVLEPANAEFHNRRGVILREMKRPEDALPSFEQAIALKPGIAEFHNNRGVSLRAVKRFDEAAASHDQAIALEPGTAEFHHRRGMICANKGDMQEAERMFSRALELNPDFPDPLTALANIRKYKNADDDDIKRMQRLLDSAAIPPDGREKLFFSLGKIYDDLGCYEEAFACYERGNQMRNAGVSYDPDQVVALANDIMNVFSRDFLARPFASASESRSPLFVVGMPRSGTTLVASIFSNHHSIATAGELPTIAEFVQQLGAWIGIGTPYPQAAGHITPAVAARLINDYEKRLRRDVGPEIPHVVDKHPLNFWHVGFIAMLFPKARIIHCTRHPLDTCLSNYFRRFDRHYDYSFDLRNIGHYFCEYARLMEHWRKVLPVQMIEIKYEDMISRTEPVVRQALDCLGLEWDERCLVPHTNPAPVETASFWQVRQPIYTESLERWRHYEKHLAPLQQALLPAGLLPV